MCFTGCFTAIFGKENSWGDISNPTKSEECTDFDCVFHGTATGKRRADGSCECVCDTGYTGPQCRSIVGQPLGWVGIMALGLRKSDQQKWGINSHFRSVECRILNLEKISVEEFTLRFGVCKFTVSNISNLQRLRRWLPGAFAQEHSKFSLVNMWGGFSTQSRLHSSLCWVLLSCSSYIGLPRTQGKGWDEFSSEHLMMGNP